MHGSRRRSKSNDGALWGNDALGYLNMSYWNANAHVLHVIKKGRSLEGVVSFSQIIYATHFIIFYLAL